jgi:hypothetical protein
VSAGDKVPTTGKNRIALHNNRTHGDVPFVFAAPGFLQGDAHEVCMIE